MLKIDTYQTFNTDRGILLDVLVTGVDQDMLYFKENDKYGLMSLNTKNGQPSLIAKAIYDDIGLFNNGVAYFKRDKQMGLINKEGKEIYANILKNMNVQDNGHYIITDKNDRIGVLDNNGKEIIEPLFASVKLIKNKVYYCERKNNVDTDEYLADIYLFGLTGDYIECFDDCKIYDNYIEGKKWKLSGLYDMNGINIIPRKYLYIKKSSDDIFYGVKKMSIDVFNFKTNQQYHMTKNFQSLKEFGIIQKGNKLYNYNNHPITEINLPKGSFLSDAISSSLFLVNVQEKKNHYSALIDEKSNIVKKFDDIIFVNEKKDNYLITKDKVMDLKGNILIDFSGSHIEYLNNNVFAYFSFYSPLSTKIVNVSTKREIDVKYFTCDNGLIVISKGQNQVGLLDKDANELLEPIYDNIGPFDNGISVIEKNNKYGVINKDGELIIKPSLPKSYIAVNNNFIISTAPNKNKHTIFDMKGNMLFKDIIYNSLFVVDDNHFIIDNVLININDISINNHLDISFKNRIIKKVFNSTEERLKVIKSLEFDINSSLNNLSDELDTYQFIKK